MKKNQFALKLSVVAVAALFTAGAQAVGTVAPTGSAAVTYAAEGVNAGNLTLSNITYNMGVGRSVGGQDITIIYTLPAGTFANAPLPIWAQGTATSMASGTAPSFTLKRGGATTNQIVYSATMAGSGLYAGNQIILSGVQVQSGSGALSTVGSSLNVTVQLLDQVETACVDNAGTTSTCLLTANLANLANASDFVLNGTTTVGVSSDSNVTKTNVGTTAQAQTVPLAGFLIDATLPADTATIAAAYVGIKVATSGVKNTALTADYSLASAATDTVHLTVTDPTSFLGLTASGLYYGSSVNAFTVAGTTGTLSILGNSAYVTSATAVSYTSNGTTPMGVSRTLSIAGRVASTAGIGHNFTTTGNSTWWSWGSNGTILETPMFSSTAGYNNRFVFMNYGTTAITYSSTCLVEPGKTQVAGTAATGTLAAGAQTVILAANVCTITGTATANSNTAARGAVRFTINAPSSLVKGVYNSVNSTTGAVDSIELVRTTTNAAQN